VLRRPQHRCLGFTVYDLPDSETGITYWTTLASVGARLPDRVLNAISSPRGRMAVCHLISSGGAPALS